MDEKPGGSCGGTGLSTADAFGGLESIRRSKPFKYAYEKEIVMYAYFKKLDYFSTECIYSPNAYRGYARAFLKDLEAIRPSVIIDIIHSGESLKVKTEIKRAVQRTCSRCGYISSNELCKACVLLEGLNRGNPAIGIRSERSRAVKEAVTQPTSIEADSRPPPVDTSEMQAAERIQSARAAAAAFAL